jgi:hypothetical protein
MLPDYYEARHREQEAGFAGDDLEEKHKNAILASAQAIPANWITPLGDAKFHVVSQSRPGWKYLVDIRVAICDCPDFPRIRLCKHLTAVQTQYLPIPPSQNSQSQGSILPHISPQILPQVAPSGSLSGEGLHLHVASISGTGTRSDALPNRDRLVPNANLWKETSKNMHVRVSPKRRQKPSASVVPSSTAQHIGPSRKRKLALYTDPYGGGEQSGKRAKPDALSVAANARARSLASSQGQLPQ